MLVLRCTKKLQTALKLKKTDLVDANVETSNFCSWYLNLIEIDGRRCLLVANDQTLFNFLIVDVPQLEAIQLIQLFKSFLHCVLADEGFEQTFIQNLMNDFTEVRFANTNSRRVLGSLNELAFFYLCHLDEEGVHSPKLPEIIKKMNRVVMGMISSSAINEVHNLLGLESPQHQW
ncbi:hypothetical protein A1507_09705 [Methylomonas koyamae]|uniref:DUF6933 domain-containing protein n=1 Tax=Methylomonas koyamae TaxID=702114 RepID=A0A177NMQ4_9GAMM|nr:hypothetical protein [Methylomonas koyamae]OAI18310.1 hypothetical protein A1507_09705 [Methylomonas koyamae]